MAFAQQLYKVVFRRTSALVLTVVVGAVIFERGFNQATEAIFCRLNEGVKMHVDRMYTYSHIIFLPLKVLSSFMYLKYIGGGREWGASGFHSTS
uniref:Cytochrome b-c1 complex subunit 9 n=1 Tax=Laticauda laticaudata TaxID=8630 RepID=A0A8C5RNB6_LATLA